MSNERLQLVGVMQAAVLTGHGGSDRLEIRDDVADPTPGPGEVVIQVAASSVNNTDIWSRQGVYGTASDPSATAGWRGVPLVFPRIQGGDVTGTVVAEGADVTGWEGRRVVVDCVDVYDSTGPDGTPVELIGSERDGGFAELVVVRADRLHDMSDSPLSDGELASLPIAYGTAMGMLERGGIGPGQQVVVTGASGGVGLAAVQLAKVAGATVTAVTSPAKAETVRSAGAGATVDRTGGQLMEQLRDTISGPVDTVVDVVGGEHFGEFAGLLRSGGQIVVAGAIAGPMVTLDLRQLYLDQRRIVGSTMHTPAHFEKLAGLARRGALRPLVAATYPLSDLHRAQADFAAKQFVGKLVVEPGATGPPRQGFHDVT